jgi:pyridoxine 5-phosphate synthase
MDHPPPRLHVNVDHVATVRQARRITSPDPVEWALLAEEAGAQGITCHLRKDRRHIQDADVRELRARITTLLNLEGSLDPEMVEFGLSSGAEEICLVPENRQEITTEGGLDVVGERGRLEEAIPRYREAGISVSLFVDPEADQLAAARDLGADFVELHTGAYANAIGDDRAREFARLARHAEIAHGMGLRVNAGHGLDYDNVAPIAGLRHVEELNIGHAIVSRAVFVGVTAAIQTMLNLIREGRP